MGFRREGNTPSHTECVETIGKMEYCSYDSKQINCLGDYTGFRICKATGKMFKMGSPSSGYPWAKLGIPNMCDNEEQYADSANALQPV